MMKDALKEQAALYVAGAMTTQECREFEDVLARNLELQLLVGQLRQSVDALVVTLPRRTPPPTLRARLLKEVEARGAIIPPTQIVTTPTTPNPWWALLPWAAAAALTFLCVHLSIQLREAQHRILEAQQQMERTTASAEESIREAEKHQREANTRNAEIRQQFLNQSLQEKKQQLARETKYVEQIKILEKKAADLERKFATLPTRTTPGTTTPNITEPDPAAPVIGGAPVIKNASSFVAVIRGTAALPNAIGAVAWDANQQRGTIAIDHLPQPPAGRDYQLWLIAGDVPISGGVLTVDANGQLQATYQSAAAIDTVNAFAISVETKGGAPRPDLNSVVMASGSL